MLHAGRLNRVKFKQSGQEVVEKKGGGVGKARIELACPSYILHKYNTQNTFKHAIFNDEEFKQGLRDFI